MLLQQGGKEQVTVPGVGETVLLEFRISWGQLRVDFTWQRAQEHWPWGELVVRRGFLCPLCGGRLLNLTDLV